MNQSAGSASSVENQDWGTWWDFTPSFFERALRLLGFPEVTVTYHKQLYQQIPLPMFTVVGRR